MAWDRGGSQDSLGVTLSKWPTVEIWNLKRLTPVVRQVERLTRTYRTFNPKLFRSLKKKMQGQKLSRKWRKGYPVTSKIGIHPMGRHQTLKVFLMLCCACRQEPSMAVLCNAPLAADWDRFRYSQPNFGLRLEIPMEELGEGLQELEGMATT